MTTLLDGAFVFIENWPLITGILVFFAVFTVPLFSRLKSDPSTGSGRRHQSVSTSMSIFLALFLVLSLFVRLAYVSKALFSSYFDSAQHYAIIKNIMTHDLLQMFDVLRVNYYHVGFHFLAAFFTSIFQVEITTVMLIFGQIILVVLPLPLFFIVQNMTKSNWVGMFTVILAAFGWYMPAHAIDWGKYPALMSIGMILLVLFLVYLFVQNKNEAQTGKRIFFPTAIGFCVLLSTIVHSRSLIVFGIIAIAWAVSALWRRLSQIPKHIIFSLTLVTLFIAIALIQRLDILSLLFDPYLNKGILVTVLVAALSIFAYRSYPQLTFVNFIVIGLLLIGLFISVNGLVPNQPHLTLMDRPYVEMILFVPLSLLGGLGLTGLEKWKGRLYGKYLALVFIGTVVFHAFANYDFYPSDCCEIVGNDDAAAMAWVENQLPVDARIGIASTELKVVAADTVEGYVGTDAGIWITPLTDRGTILLPYNLEFDQETTLDSICQKRISHLFVGELGSSFDTARLNFRPAWYRPLLTMPQTRVYEVIGCDDE